MKANRYLSGTLIILLLLFSCGKDFLKEEPIDRLVSASFFKNTKHIEQSIHPLYALAADCYGQNAIGMQMGSDELLSVDNMNKWEMYEQSDLYVNDGTGFRAPEGYSEPYQAIKQANFILEGVDNADAPEAVKNLAKGQAHCIRAMMYFYLTRFYGPVPMVTSTNAGVEIELAEPEKVYDFILEELEKAEEFLPESNWGTPDLGSEVLSQIPSVWKNNKALATGVWVKSVRANVYLTMAGWPLEKGQEYYKLAAEEAKSIIDNADNWGIKLMADYQDLWLIENNFNREGLITFGYNILGIHNQLAPNSGRPASEPVLGEPKGWNDFMVEIPFYEKFPEGYRKSVTFLEGWYLYKDKFYVEWDDVFTEIHNQDTHPDILHSWRTSTNPEEKNLWVVLNRAIPENVHNYRHPYVAKWRDTDDFPHDSTHVEGANSKSNRSIMVMRYPHILLIYAEAQARADGAPDNLAYEALNQVRRRAMKVSPNSSSEYDISELSPKAFIDSVLAEKGWEFICEPEGRWFDLVRLKMVESIIPDIIAQRIALRDSGYLHPAILIPGEKYPIPTDIRRLHWHKYPEDEFFLNPDLYNPIDY
jgi:starch-binding outer membrane protein, SusD/RagB family